MVDMKPSNAKLQERGVRMIQDATGASAEEAAASLRVTNDVRASIEQLNKRG
jgi:N-acetylmuramic acid 6-phosphate (MurNAc-6-P) etherase